MHLRYKMEKYGSTVSRLENAGNVIQLSTATWKSFYKAKQSPATRSRIHDCTILLMFLGIILRVLRLEVSVYKICSTNQFQTTFAQRGGGSNSVGDCK
jgi:hypothetical protein